MLKNWNSKQSLCNALKSMRCLGYNAAICTSIYRLCSTGTWDSFFQTSNNFELTDTALRARGVIAIGAITPYQLYHRIYDYTIPYMRVCNCVLVSASCTALPGHFQWLHLFISLTAVRDRLCGPQLRHSAPLDWNASNISATCLDSKLYIWCICVCGGLGYGQKYGVRKQKLQPIRWYSTEHHSVSVEQCASEYTADTFDSLGVLLVGCLLHELECSVHIELD